MAKMYKIITYVVDLEEFGGNMWCNEIENTIDNGITNAYASCFHIKESKPFKWDDDLKINSCLASIDDFEKYF